MRMSKLAAVGLVVGLLFGLSMVGFAEETSEMYSIELSEATTQAVEDHFSEYKKPATELVDASGTFAIEKETSISMTFVGEGAGYKNQVGFFTFDANGAVLSETLVFENFSGTGNGLAGGGSLNAGDTKDIGTFTSGENVGFFLIANGYQQKNAPTWYTLAGLNSDGKDHDAVLLTEDGTLIGFEDLKNLGDRDYNDALLLVTTAVIEPELTEEIIDEVVDGQPEAQQVTPQVVLDVQAALGLSMSDAEVLVNEYGAVRVKNALRKSNNPDSFWAILLGFELELFAGGGGGSAAFEGSFEVVFQLRHPLTQELVTHSMVTLTVADADSNILDVFPVPFDQIAEAYAFELDTTELQPGAYELYLGFEDGNHHLMSVVVPEA